MEGESMSKWKELRAQDFCFYVTDGTHDSPKRRTKGYYLLTSKHIGKDTLDFESAYKISEDDYLKIIERSKVEQYDILYSMIGTIGNVHIVKEDKVNFAVKNMGIFKFNGDYLHSLWMYYWLKSTKATEYIKSRLSGSTQQYITLSSLRDFPISIPEIDIMRLITGILSSLDAKIETNNKLNEKLEEMAQAIFKSWFVDFEPFKDKPFHETEIGYIPQIFESGVLGDLCTFKRGKGLLSKDAIFGNVPVIAGGMKPACYHNIANTKAPVVTVSGSGANAGYTQIHNVDVWASDCSFIDSNCENLYYVYCFLSRRPKLLRHSQTGAAQPHVKPADIHRFQVVIPTKDVINEFQQIVKPLFDRIGMNKKENDRLASLRDTLLPRLMSGELIV